MRCFLWTTAIGLVICAAGCGTLANLEGKEYPLFSAGGQPTRVYGGIRKNIGWVANAVGLPESTQTHTDPKRNLASFAEDPVGVACGIPVFGYFLIVDPALSLIGDTVTLPLVLRQAHHDRRDESVLSESKDAQQTSLEVPSK